MANVRVAVRVRPLSKRETKEGGRIIMEVDGKVAKIRNLKVDNRPDGFGDSREKVVAFGFDYCYWSVNPEDPQYASQDVVFQDLGTEVLSGAAKGYNICLFAYGQTGSGKTYTMLGTPASVGLTPRICEGLFIREEDYAPLPSSCRIKVSFLEIYNERVRDLLKQSDQKKSYSLRVREHPEMGPYVQGLSQHVVTNYKQVIQLLEEGIANRITAATHVHEASSRSHAIFTIYYTQAILENNLPSEIASKINLVDLAGSERADPSYCKDRITEGANINKSLVTLGIVISTLAQNSQAFSSCQSLNSAASDGGDSGIPSSPSGTSSGGGPSRRQSYIPYRDSVLTWLLKDSLGGNSKTIMVATVSPAHTSYSETMSTLRYASNAKHIVNKPRVNEDANIKLIRELREEIRRLKAMLLSFELRNFSSLNEDKDENLKELVLQNELKIDQLTKDWTRKWNEWKALLEHYRVDINRRRAGVVIDSSLPHLMALEDDVLSTGVVLYHLKEGTTKIGRIDSDQEQDIVLQGQWIERDHCTITSACGVVILRPAQGARCTVNGREVTASCRLTQGAVITLGKAQKFRFNHPAEAAVLRQRRQVGEVVGGNGSLEWLDLDGDVTASRLGLCPLLWKESIFLSQDPSTMVPPLPDPTDQMSETIPSEEYLPQAASYPPRTGHFSKNALCSSGKGHLCKARGALARKGASASGTCLTVSSESASIQEMESMGNQPCWMVSQSLASLDHSANKLKPKDEPEALSPSTYTRRGRGLADSDHTRSGWRKEGNVGTHKTAKGARCSSSHPCGPRQASGHGKAAKTFWVESKPPSSSKASKRQERVLVARARDIVRNSSCLPHGSSLRRQHSAGDPDSTSSLTDCSPRVDLVREKDGDLSDADSSYSVDSLSYVYAKAQMEPLKPEDLQGKEQDLPESENSESDDSQISEDSLAEKGYESPPDSSGSSYLTNHHGHPRARAKVPVRGFTMSSDSELFTQTCRSFSLDSLIDAKEELGEDQQEPFFSSADEMPAETFWHLQTSSLPIVDQEAMCRLGSINHRTGTRLDAILPMSSSFYLGPPPQPHCEQPESEVEVSSSEQANTLQGLQLSRGSPLLSMDSWFSCDSKINSSSPSGIVGSLCPSPDFQEFQPQGQERPGQWQNMEELKPSRAETLLPYNSKVPQGGTELPCHVRGVYTIPASDTSRLSFWGSYSLLQPRVAGIFRARGTPDTAQQGNLEASNTSSLSSVLAASAASLTHVGSAPERDWAALQQKYLLELSHPVLEAVREPRPAFPSLEEDSTSLTQASGKETDTVLPVGFGVSSSLHFSTFPLHFSKIRHLRAEKEQDSLSAEIEGTSDFLTTREKEVSHSGTYSADVESLTSGTINAPVFVAENKVANSMTQAREDKQNSLEESSQSNGKPELMTSSDECFFLKSPCHSNVTIATKENHGPRGWAPLRKNSAGQEGHLSHSSCLPLQEEKVNYQESSREVVGRHTSVSFASGPEPYPHSAAWNPFLSSLKPPPLETFYVTKSRDALTETALEIPACRESRVPSPPPREAWGFGHDHQVLHNVYVKSNLPVLLQNHNSKIPSSQQVTAGRPVHLNTKEVIRKMGKCPGNTEEESHNSVYLFVGQKRHFLSSSTKVCEFENQVGILNEHSLSALEEKEKATIQSYCNVSSNHCRSGRPLLVCESEADGEEEQDHHVVLRQTQEFDMNRQLPSGARSDFIYKTINLALDNDMLGETAVSLQSKSVCHRVRGPEMMAQDESPAHKGGGKAEGKSESGLLGKSLHSKGCSKEFKLPQTESTYERFRSVISSQEKNLSECKGSGRSQETLNPKEEPSGRKQNKRVNSADEMARLIRSVMKLENGILEIESKQNKRLYAPPTQGVSKESVFQDQRDREMADCDLRSGSSGNHLSFKDQPSSPKQIDDITFRDSEAGEMEVNNSIGKGPQVRKIILSPFKLRECIQDIKFMTEHTPPAVLDRPSWDTCDCIGTCTAGRGFADTCGNPRTEALASALPSQPRLKMSSEKESEAGNASACPRGQPCSLGGLEELETVKDFQESQVAKHVSSSKQKGPKAQGRVEEMIVRTGGSLLEEDKMVSWTQKVPSPSPHCVSTSFSQETGPLLSQPDSSVAPHRDLSGTLPLDSARLPRNYLHACDTVHIDYVLDPTMFKMTDSPLVTGAGRQDQSGEPRSYSPQGDVRGGFSLAHTAWCESVIATAMASHGQFHVPESISLGAESRRSASTQDEGGDLRSIVMGLSPRESFASEAEAAVQRGSERASPLKRGFSPLEKTSCLLEEGNSQGQQAKQKAEKEAKDLSPAGGAFSAPVSLPRVPHPEHCAHTSTDLAVLEEIRQAKAQGKQLHGLGADGNVLPYYVTLLEPEHSSGARGRPQCPQRDQSVSDRTRNEDEAQGFYVTSRSAEPGHLSTDEATPLPTDSFQQLPNTETKTGPRHPSQTSSHAAPVPGKSHCTGERRHFLGAGEQFVCHCSSSEIMEKKKKATRTPSSADPVSSDSFPSTLVVDWRVRSEKAVAALSSWAPSGDPGMISCGGSQLAQWETAEGTRPGGQETNPVHHEPRILDTTCGGGSGNFSVAAQGGETTCSESGLVTCDVQNSVSLSGRTQDHDRCFEASIGLEEGGASPKQGTILPGAPRRADTEAPSQHHVKWEESDDCGLAEACSPANSASSKHPRPTPLPDQRPSPDSEVQEESQCRHPQETLDCVVISGSMEGSRALSPPRGQEDSGTSPCWHLCNPQPMDSRACASPSYTLSCYRDGDLRKRSAKTALHTLQPPCIVSSRACGMDETAESYSREPEVLWTPGLEPKGICVVFAPADIRSWEPSASAPVLSLAQEGSSPSAPDVMTCSLSHSVADGSSRSGEDPEKKVAEKKASLEPEATFSSADMYSEPLREFQDSSVGGQNAQDSQTKPEPPLTTGRPYTLNLSEGSIESELLGEPQHGCLEDAIQCLPEKTQLSTESRDHSGLDPQARFVAKLKRISRHQADSPWDEEEQQRHQASGGREEPAQGRSSQPSHEGGLDSCRIIDAGREEASVAHLSVSKMLSSGFEDSASMPLGQSGAPWPTPQSPGLPASGREQLAPHHGCSLPVISVFSGPKHSRSSPRPQFSVVSSSRSLQELNLSVEPPSPTDEDTQEPNRWWTPHPRGHFKGKSAAGTSLKAEGCSQKASSNWDMSTAGHQPPQPANPPYPKSSDLSCMPIPDFMTGWTSSTLEESWQENPEKWHSRVEKGTLHFGSRDINPYILSSRPEGPVHIGWKQYVFGSAADVSCTQGPIPSSMARCSSMDDGLEDQNSPLHSHLSTYANGRDLGSTQSSIRNAQGSHEAWEVWGSSFALGSPHILNTPEGTIPSKGPDKRAQTLGTPDEAGCLRSRPLLAEENAAGPVDEIMLLYPSEACGPVGQSRMNTLEQGTQTLGCSVCWSSTDISAQPETSAVPGSGLVSWTSMHNLSLHLSQLLHSTSELLGSFSQPSVAEKERNVKRESPDEMTQALMMDCCTQTTMDEGIQTELALPPLHLPTPEANPQEVNVVLEVLGSDIPIMSQKKGHVTGTLQRRESEETAWKMAGPSESQEESPHFRPQSFPAPAYHSRLQKAHFGQNLPSVIPQASLNASLPPSIQAEEPSCLAVNSPSLKGSHSPGPCPSPAESMGNPKVQKELGTVGTLLVDRASSPILTLSASTQGLELSPVCLSLTAPSACPLEGRQNFVSSPDLFLDSPRPPVDNYSQIVNESGDSQRVGAPCGEGGSPLERSDSSLLLEVRSPVSPPHIPKLQVCFIEQPPQQLQPKTTTLVQSRPPPPSLRSQSPSLADDFVPEDVASLECGSLSSREPSEWRSKTENEGEPQPTLDFSSSRGGLHHLRPCPVSELTATAGLQGPTLRPTCQSEVLLCSSSQGQKPLQFPDNQSQDPEWSQREQIPLQIGAQNLSLSTELTEAKLHHGFGEADALLQVLQSGTGEALAAEEPLQSTWEELFARQKQTIEALRRERAERLQNLHQTRNLSPQKQLSLLPNRDLPTWDLGLPSRRREYLQQLRKDVVETTRSPGSASRSAHPASDIALMLQEYQRAREEAKVEIARARTRLQERTEQEKLRIRQQIISQLLREEEKLHTLAASSSLSASSNGSLSSGLTSGYNSSNALLSDQLQSPDSMGDTHLPDSSDSWIGDVRGHSAVRNSQLSLAGSTWKSLAYSRRTSLGSCCCFPSSLSSLGAYLSSSYQDLAKHIVDISIADVMAACSGNLHNLFSCQPAAGWNHQGEEQEVHLYYKMFSSTRHGFLGAGVVSQPLSHVWAAVSDPTLWPLYHKPIQTARLHQRVTNSINLVYLVCSTALCALKQPRDFCCVCVEAKEGHLSVMAAQSVYDTSMPRPSRDMVRGEILPSAWILQPLTVEGRDITRVIYLAQVELGAPGFPPQLLSSFIKQQPLVIARLASFLGS
ncbi:star-related lipid transfer protein [Lynx pardinus]|uniref:StAR-related lipid transfer protein 9 n=1 Tax=Lynx pardinus TaxID=191816 RepID=A0A485MQR2_LYNPA|nr:star-related lipid transfer protein [Lynx pardinus]